MPLLPNPGTALLAGAFFLILVAITIALWGILNTLEGVYRALRERTR